MEFEHTISDGILVVTPKVHTIDARGSREFKEDLLKLITHEQTRNVVIDLKQVEFIDSSGLGSFLAVLKNMHAEGGELKLSSMNKPIRTIFELISLHKIFEIFNSTEDAIHSYK